MFGHTEVLPVSLPGLRAVRFRVEGLYSGIKEEWSIGQTEVGSSTFWSRGKVQSTVPGSIHIKRPGDVHRDISRDAPGVVQSVTLPKALVERIEKVALPNALAPNDPRSAPFQRLHDVVRRRVDRFALEVALTEAVDAIASFGGATTETRPVRRAIEMLRTKLGEPVSLDDLAEHADLDKFHLCRAFRAQIGMPPHAYLTCLRIWRAKELLREGVKPSAVAPQVGLYDQSQLNRHFRRIVGVTPGEYQRRSA